MPCYIFSCSSCDSHWEEYLTMDNCRQPLEALSKCCEAEVQRVYTVPQVISDDLGFKGVVNPCDGKVYDSKVEYHRTLKRNGCEVVDTPAAAPKPDVSKDLKADIAQAYQQHS